MSATRCTCKNGNAVFQNDRSNDNDEMLCETDHEDCYSCFIGYQLSAPAGTGQQLCHRGGQNPWSDPANASYPRSSSNAGPDPNPSSWTGVQRLSEYSPYVHR